MMQEKYELQKKYGLIDKIKQINRKGQGLRANDFASGIFGHLSLIEEEDTHLE